MDYFYLFLYIFLLLPCIKTQFFDTQDRLPPINDVRPPGTVTFPDKGGRILSENNDDDEEVENERRGKRNFSKCQLSNEEERKLICTCDNNEDVLELTKLSPSYRTLLSKKDLFHSLEIDLCSLIIKRDFFTELQYQIPLQALEIRGARTLRIEQHSLEFSYLGFNGIKIRILFDKIGGPLSIHQYTFGQAAESVTFQEVKFIDFSTDSFLGINKTAEIIINNSNLTSKCHDMKVGTLHVRSLSISGCTVDTQQGRSFLHLSTQNLSFVDSVLISMGQSSFEVLVREAVVFDRVRFLSPGQRMMSGIKPAVVEESRLEMSNVVLEDPARGCLLTTFQRADFENVSVSLCLCNVTRFLLSETDTLGSRMFNLPPTMVPDEGVNVRLENATYCLLRADKILGVEEQDQKEDLRFRPQDFCPGGSGANARGDGKMDPATSWILAVLVLGIFAVLGFLGVFVYRWHRVLQLKYRMMKALRVVRPDEKVYNGYREREEREVTFRETVKIIPSMPSVYYIDQDATSLGESGDQPDLIRIHYKGFDNKTLSLQPSNTPNPSFVITKIAKNENDLEQITTTATKAEMRTDDKFEEFEVVPLDDDDDNEYGNTGSVIVRESARD